MKTKTDIAESILQSLYFELDKRQADLKQLGFGKEDYAEWRKAVREIKHTLDIVQLKYDKINALTDSC